MAKSPRPLSTVVLHPQQKQTFVDDIKEYLHPRTRRWYSDRGIPYRRGYLLCGPPGTSLCVAVAGLLRLEIYLLNMSGRNLDEDSLLSLFGDLPRRCIVLLEDVDTAGVTRRQEDGGDDDPESDRSASDHKKSNGRQPQHLSLSALLNILDGVVANEGRILIMTTGHDRTMIGPVWGGGRQRSTAQGNSRFNFGALEWESFTLTADPMFLDHVISARRWSTSFRQSTSGF